MYSAFAQPIKEIGIQELQKQVANLNLGLGDVDDGVVLKVGNDDKENVSRDSENSNNENPFTINAEVEQAEQMIQVK